MSRQREYIRSLSDVPHLDRAVGPSGRKAFPGRAEGDALDLHPVPNNRYLLSGIRLPDSRRRVCIRDREALSISAKRKPRQPDQENREGADALAFTDVPELCPLLRLQPQRTTSIFIYGRNTTTQHADFTVGARVPQSDQMVRAASRKPFAIRAEGGCVNSASVPRQRHQLSCRFGVPQRYRTI